MSGVPEMEEGVLVGMMKDVEVEGRDGKRQGFVVFDSSAKEILGRD